MRLGKSGSISIFETEDVHAFCIYLGEVEDIFRIDLSRTKETVAARSRFIPGGRWYFRIYAANRYLIYDGENIEGQPRPGWRVGTGDDI